MKLPTAGSSMRGAAAFVLTELLGIIVATAATFFFMARWGWPNLSGIVFVAIIWAVYLALAAPIVFVLTIPLRFISIPRPMADVAIWAVAFAVLAVSVWGPAAAEFADSDNFAITAPLVIIPLCFGAVMGWWYWRLAGCPKPGD